MIDKDDIGDHCTVCLEPCVENGDSISCSICQNRHHQECSGLTQDVYDALIAIINHTGWVCMTCRDDRRGKLVDMEIALTKTNEELADMRISVAYLSEEMENIKCSTNLTNNTIPINASGPDNNSHKQELMSEMTIVVHRTLKDKAKRKCNVVITGLPEPNEESEDSNKLADKDIFVDLCEQHLDVKPAVNSKGCIHLGQRTEGKGPRKLLVHLNSESSATSLLHAAHLLRHHRNCSGVYINPDLSPAEAKIAYEQRQRRRHQTALQNSAITERQTIPRDHELPVLGRTDIPGHQHISILTTQYPAVDDSQHSDATNNHNVMDYHLSTAAAEFIPGNAQPSSSAE